MQTVAKGCKMKCPRNFSRTNLLPISPRRLWRMAASSAGRSFVKMEAVTPFEEPGIRNHAAGLRHAQRCDDIRFRTLSGFHISLSGRWERAAGDVPMEMKMRMKRPSEPLAPIEATTSRNEMISWGIDSNREGRPNQNRSSPREAS